MKIGRQVSCLPQQKGRSQGQCIWRRPQRGEMRRDGGRKTGIPLTNFDAGWEYQTRSVSDKRYPWIQGRETSKNRDFVQLGRKELHQGNDRHGDELLSLGSGLWKGAAETSADYQGERYSWGIIPFNSLKASSTNRKKERGEQKIKGKKSLRRQRHRRSET